MEEPGLAGDDLATPGYTDGSGSSAYEGVGEITPDSEGVPDISVEVRRARCFAPSFTSLERAR